MTLELPSDDPRLARQTPRKPESNLRDVHRRYAQVTSAEEAIAYVGHAAVEVGA